MRIIIRTGTLEALPCTAVKALPHAGNASAAPQKTPYHRTEKPLRLSGKGSFIIWRRFIRTTKQHKRLTVKALTKTLKNGAYAAENAVRENGGTLAELRL